jgi:kynurenine 3-monooxygenase
MAEPPPITVVGAGPVGTLIAVMLAARGRHVRLLERRADPRLAPPERGRSINLALAARGLRALEDAGLLAAITPQLTVMRGRMLHDEHGAISFLPYGQDEHEVIYSIGRERLNLELIITAARHPGIELKFMQRCMDVDPIRQHLRVRDERGIERDESFALLLAADGAGSAVRAALVERGLTMAREEPLAHDYKEFVIPPDVRGDYVLEPHALHIWPRGGYMLIALPNADGSFTATLFLPREGQPGFDTLAEAAAVRAFFREQFADVDALIPDLEQQFATHPQGRLATLYCEHWHVGRALLLGDAAHAIVPFHGQGLNCGFEDCVLLDELLAVTADTPLALAEFERRRRVDTDAIAAMALENYLEMRDGVRDPGFVRRRALAAELERAFPGRFIPRYSMVMFHPEIPYAAARRRGALQEWMLDELLAHPPQPGDERVAAEVLLQTAGL